jgi:hypothetical protein
MSRSLSAHELEKLEPKERKRFACLAAERARPQGTESGNRILASRVPNR